MKQIKIAQAYDVTNRLSKDNNLTIAGKWGLYKLRKDLLSHYEFYIEESRNLFNTYKTTTTDTGSIKFESPEYADEYLAQQANIDNFDVDVSFEKQQLKLSDIPNISIQQIELLDDFIEFLPE